MDVHRRLEHFSRPGSAYFVTWRLDGSLPVAGVTDFWTSDGPKFVELDQLLDPMSTGPRWLERRDVAGVVANALWKGVRESRYELGLGWYARLQRTSYARALSENLHLNVAHPLTAAAAPRRPLLLETRS